MYVLIKIKHQNIDPVKINIDSVPVCVNFGHFFAFSYVRVAARP